MKSSKKLNTVNIKHVPLRTCVACRQVKNKKELIRLVRKPEGNVDIDSTGKITGRGAYLCFSRECWEAGLKGNNLEHTLRCTLTSDNRHHLIEQAQSLLKGVN